ncbi:MAG: hypothetical protein L6N95_01435 [Candidatus Methylarchaceae archaeon HK01B]|nr:hypothetical protein [Candidatus Methylarchaceae archaeon HK02M1]MCP8318475.1 hypothetical protein [Candidatus Methylarchaceae archaeon HK01B]
MVGIDKKNHGRIKMCFTSILERRYSDARGLIKPSDGCQGSDIGPGVKFAIEGIINFSKENDLDLEKMKKLRKLLKSRLSSTSNDNFDRDYFKTWIKFINFLQRQTRSDE